MKARFMAQPFNDGYDLHHFLVSLSSIESLTRLTVVVAWVKERALRRVQEELKQLASRAETRLIVGIDEGGATRQGLELSQELFDETFVFHDRSGRTFHPKVYSAAGPSSASILVGSHNLTPGGLYFNYEAGVILELDRALPEDQSVLDDIDGYIQRLMNDQEICLPLDDDLFQELTTNPRYRVADEYSSARKPTLQSEDSLDTDTDLDSESGRSVFGKSAHEKRPAPPLPLRGRVANGRGDDRDPGSSTSSAESSDAVPTGATDPPAAGQPETTATATKTVTKRWFKTLNYSDGQQRRTANTNPTGNMKLTQAGHPIDHNAFFRHTFFRDLAWQQTVEPRGVRETAEVDVEVFVAGQQLGHYSLRVDHAEWREAGQSNVPTWLHWEKLAKYLQSNNHRGKVLSIERLSDGSSRIYINTAASGPFKG